LFNDADKLARIFDDPVARQGLRSTLEGKLMYAFFYEKSTRTRFSFCTAASHLGMRPIWTEDAEAFSSAAKGETLEHTIHALCQYEPDVIVLRHKEAGAADRAAAIVDHHGYSASIINGGDGKGQHPTQALLDVYTIWRELKRIDSIKVAIGGDLANGRTVRSLVYLLSKFTGIEFTFLSPENLRIGEDIISHLREHGIPFKENVPVEEALREADVVYWTRTQSERGSVNTRSDLTITRREADLMKGTAILLHPMPIVDEIAREVDDHPRAAYFRQMRNGIIIRMLLLEELCEE
jgi:aspartate carbamoyltransferase catalytic subunit